MHETALKKVLMGLTPPQRRMLSQFVSPDGSAEGGRGHWQVFDALIRKGLLVHVWLDDYHVRGRYDPAEGVPEAYQAVCGETASRTKEEGDDERI